MPAGASSSETGSRSDQGERFGHGAGSDYPTVAAPRTWAAGPIFGVRSAHCSRLLALRCAGRAASAGAADPPFAALDASPARAARRSGAERRARRRPPHRPRRLLAQPALSLLPASNEKLAGRLRGAVACSARATASTPRWSAPARCRDVWHGDLFLRGFGDPTLASSGPRRARGECLVGDPARDGRRHRRRVVVRRAPHRPRAGSRASTSASRRRSRRSSSTARFYRGQTSHEPAARGRLAASAGASRRAASPSAARSRVGLADDGGPPARARPLRAAREDRPLHGARERQLHGRAAREAARRALRRPRGTTAAGARVVREELAAAGVPLAGVRLADGSGLSSLDRLTASAVVALLEAGLADPAIRDAFLGSLAVAGVDGTLEHRLESRPARGRVIAKTGTTSAACALSGFVRDRYVFAILQNGAPGLDLLGAQRPGPLRDRARGAARLAPARRRDDGRRRRLPARP